MVAALLLTSCSIAPPSGDDRIARQAITDLQAGRVELVRDRFDSAAASPQGPLTPALLTVTDTLRTLAPVDSGKLIGWNVVEAGGNHRAVLTYEIPSRGHWSLVTVGLNGSGQGARLIGLNVNSIPEPLERATAFSLRGKSPAHYLALAIMILCAAVSLGSAVLVACTRMRRRWLWALAALVGAGTFQLDWASGASRFLPFQFLLFSAGFGKGSAYAPWIISFALPIGAAAALERRRRALAAARSAAIPVIADSPVDATPQ